VDRQRLLSVTEAAAELHASEAYVRRLLIRERLYGIKVGPVWAIYGEDLEIFKRGRRAPGRPPKSAAQRQEEADAQRRIATERMAAGTERLLRQPREPAADGLWKSPAG